MDWSKKEVEIIIQDYFAMLLQELRNEKYNKTSHRNILIPQLLDRTKGSVEFKHQNISAVLAKFGIPYIKGYKPLGNYQQLLEEHVSTFISDNLKIYEPYFEKFANQTVVNPISENFDFDKIIDESDVESTIVKEPEPSYRPVKVNFLEREQNNRTLGELGEKLVIDYEKWRLIKAGKESLAEKVEWISKNEGDGTGFDILSRNNNGTDRYIEVKTTKLTKESPIYFSQNELLFAKSKSKDFFLYRVFNFAEKPRMFIRQGEYNQICTFIQPQSYKGFF